MNTHVVSALFDTSDRAEVAISSLRAAGVPDAALSVIGKDDVHAEGHSESPVTGGLEDDTVDSKPVARGIMGGAALGALLGVAALALPGVGPFVAAGAVAAVAAPGAMAAGAIIGAGAGGLREALSHHGVHADDADFYERSLEQGGVVVMVNIEESGLSATDLTDILDREGGRTSTRMTTAEHAIA